MRPFVALHYPNRGKTVILGVSSAPDLVARVASAVLQEIQQTGAKIKTLASSHSIGEVGEE